MRLRTAKGRLILGDRDHFTEVACRTPQTLDHSALALGELRCSESIEGCLFLGSKIGRKQAETTEIPCPEIYPRLHRTGECLLSKK